MGLYQVTVPSQSWFNRFKRRENKGNTKKETEVSLSLTNFVLSLCIIT